MRQRNPLVILYTTFWYTLFFLMLNYLYIYIYIYICYCLLRSQYETDHCTHFLYNSFPLDASIKILVSALGYSALPYKVIHCCSIGDNFCKPERTVDSTW
jgi:hypothetical protein